MHSFLQIDHLSGFHDLRSDFDGGLDYTAYICFKTTKPRLLSIVSDLDFPKCPKREPNQGLQFAGFSAAPDLPPIEVAVVYFREAPYPLNDLQHIITDPAHEQAWFVSMDY